MNKKLKNKFVSQDGALRTLIVSKNRDLEGDVEIKIVSVWDSEVDQEVELSRKQTKRLIKVLQASL